MKKMILCFSASLASLFVILGCTGNRADYDRVLERAQQQNVNYDSITGLDSITEAVSYFDRHGNTNDRMRAHYLMGCAYRDAGESPKALECYQDAADCADTTSTDCDYSWLMKIHSQMAELFYQQNLPYDMLRSLKLQQKYALSDSNMLVAINAIERKSHAFNLLNLSDSVINCGMEAYNSYLKYGYSLEAARSMGPLVVKFVEKGELEKAKKCINVYEAESGFFKKGEINARKAIYYYSKSQYLLSINKVDSACTLFRKLISSNRTGTQKEAGYHGLYLLYKKLGQPDSMAKYANLCYEQSNENFVNSSTEKMRQMQSLYNYSRAQTLAGKMEARANRDRSLFLIALFVCIVLILVALGIWLHLSHKRREALQRLSAQYRHDKEMLVKAQNDILSIKDAAYAKLLEEKEADIAKYGKLTKEYEDRQHFKLEAEIKDKILHSGIYLHLRHVLKTPNSKVTKKDWAELERMLNEAAPNFKYEVHKTDRSLSEEEYRICMLVRIYLKPKDIASLLKIAPSTLSMIRMRLLSKIYGIEGKPEELDKRIQSIC